MNGLIFPSRQLMVAALIPLLFWGCGNDRPVRRASPISMEESSSIRLADVDIEAVRPMAERVFKTHYRLDPALSTPDLLVARPKDVDPEPDRQRVRDVLSITPNRHRQLGQLRLTRSDGAVVARCQILVQRLDTAERGAFQPERGDDRPGDRTPIDRQGTTSAQLPESWVTLHRDRQLEQEILRTLSDALQGSR